MILTMTNALIDTTAPALHVTQPRKREQKTMTTPWTVKYSSGQPEVQEVGQKLLSLSEFYKPHRFTMPVTQQLVFRKQEIITSLHF